MLTKNKIKNIWKLNGWNDEQDYHRYLFTNAVISYKNLNTFLDPDKVSPRAFWKATDEHFGTDTVCNVSQQPKKRSLVIEECNKENHKIPLHLGLLGLTDLAIASVRKYYGLALVGEIGCGYGSFYENHIAKRDDIFLYKGFDVVKRFDQACLVEGKDGTFTKKQVEELKNSINVFYSCNVFQHLSPKKIKKYLKQMYQILPRSGHCVLSYIKPPKNKTSYHYGQCVEIMLLNDFYKACTDAGFIIECKIEQSIHKKVTFDSIGVLLTKLE